MNTKISPSETEDRPSEDEIREYAHHLYIKSGWLPGRDLDNWLEAEAYLIAERQERRAPHRTPHRSTPAHLKSRTPHTPELHSSR